METPQQIILTEKKMDFLLGIPKIQNRTKRIPNPCAQYPVMFAPVSEPVSASAKFLQAIIHIKNKNEIVYIVAWLILIYGLRVSEILSIKSSDFRSGIKIFIKGKKKSDSRFICYAGIENEIEKYKSFSGFIFGDYSRWYFYREFLKLGIVLNVKGNNKRAVTHAGRHLIGQELKNSGDSTADIQHFLQHKNINSTKNYTGELKK